jgi:hypothetical protein
MCLLCASLVGCGARSAGMVSSERPAAAIHGEGPARRGLNASADTEDARNRQYDATPTIVIGFVGGFVRHSDRIHSPVQVAGRLRDSYPSGVYVEVFENRHREEAHRKILEILGETRKGKLSDSAKQRARIIIYGMSWGGSETVALARELQDDRIPVLLTVQVDSVAKVGQNDEVIPANVAEAANFYQTDGLLHGRAQIRAEKGAGTRIIGNFHYQYKTKSPSCDEYPWYDRLFTKYHTKIECDPEVWNRVETLIRAKLPPARDQVAKQGLGSQHCQRLPNAGEPPGVILPGGVLGQQTGRRLPAMGRFASSREYGDSFPVCFGRMRARSSPSPG